VTTRLPLHGVRVLDYSQYVAGPLATMLLADLGADVIKVEPPRGDAWRHYAPHSHGESRHFYALNRNKRSVVIDLKTTEGRLASHRLIATADAVVHNFPPERAARFGLDHEAIRHSNPDTVCVWVSAFGSNGEHAQKLGYDLIAQALSGLLMADVRLGDDVPRRSGGVPTADLLSGVLLCVSVLAGLHQRKDDSAPQIEVSLMGAALAAQAQRFVRLESERDAPAPGCSVTVRDLECTARSISSAEDLEPYYRCYETSDGYIALACLNSDQRRKVLDLLVVDDPWHDNPQATPRDESERAHRERLRVRFGEEFKRRSTSDWLALLGPRGVPVGEVRQLDALFDDEQAQYNGLVQSIEQPGVGRVSLLGNLFKVNGEVTPAGRPAPRLGEHTMEVLSALSATAAEPVTTDRTAP
jgi:crotonobetainyl-CoA:carnitine CoA-transferase CaiB-like acyl-CoA transferase